jgi:hypothetical protein
MESAAEYLAIAVPLGAPYRLVRVRLVEEPEGA